MNAQRKKENRPLMNPMDENIIFCKLLLSSTVIVLTSYIIMSVPKSFIEQTIHYSED